MGPLGQGLLDPSGIRVVGQLKQGLLSIAPLNCDNIVIAGDWNCTVSCLNDANNIDILNMRSPPNVRHSVLLKKMCDDLDLSDPFRVKYPNRRDFSYQPSAILKTNRSRIDFFIVSNNLIEKILSSSISQSLQNKMFDHRAIHLDFRRPPKVIRNPTISKSLLKDPDIDLVVKLSIFETYLHHTNSLDEPSINEYLRDVGLSKSDLVRIGPDSSVLPHGYRSDHDELVRSARASPRLRKD